MPTANRRQFGDKINFKSLTCAPINEHGVVYLFGLLHDAFDFKIESVQAGFPDCIARRRIDKDRWEELRIEFEFESQAFRQHGHDPNGADMIVCWKHNWKDCPDHIEVIELSKMINNLEGISEEVTEKKERLSEYQGFCRRKRLEGYSFSQIAPMWKAWNGQKKQAVTSPKLTAYQQFAREKRLEGKTFREIGELWRREKEI